MALIKCTCVQILQAEIDPNAWRIAFSFESTDPNICYASDIFNLIYGGYPTPQQDFVEGNVYDCFKLILDTATWDTSSVCWKLNFFIRSTNPNAYAIDDYVGLSMDDANFRRIFPQFTANREYDLNLQLLV